MPSEVTTLCFHTRDAVRRSEGSFTFDLPSKSLRDHASKVALASCEFPIVQQTIEPEWNRFYYMEGIRLTHEDDTLSVVVHDDDSGRPAVHHLGLPPRWNDAKVRSPGAGHGAERRVTIETTHPHNLFGADRHPLPVFAKLVLASVTGDIDLENIEYVDETTFHARGRGFEAGGAGSIFCPCVVSPLALASLLTECAQRSALPLAFVYEDETDRIVPRVGRFPPGTKLRILPGRLATLCGFSTVMYRPDQVGGTLPSGGGGWFSFTELPSGFYAPCHRPMCVGQPLPFGPVLEMSMNRYYFPLLGAGSGGGSGGGGSNSHLLVFSNPDGGVQTCTIPPGRYTESGLASYLEAEMTTAAAEAMGDGTVQYAVRVDDDHRWRFECERKVRGEWREAIFGLLFHHPLSVDPLRFGFAPHALGGASSYVSSMALRTPPDTRNLLRLGEDGPRKRFRAHAVSLPVMVGVVKSVDAVRSTIVYVTHVNRRRYVSGLCSGDTVRISSFSSMEVADAVEEIAEGNDNGDEGRARRSTTTATATPVRLHGVHTCRVGHESGRDDSPSLHPTEVLIRVAPCLFAKLATVGSTVQIVSDCEPWSLHVGKEGSLPPHMLGWSKGGVLWGRDGSNEGLPPYEAPHVHSLDHPDYVCMTFSEMGGANLEHTYDHVTRPIFCKLSLYPLFREERMLPRDTNLLRDNMASFTLSFWNPDMVTPYHFHGAEFSFSLAFFMSAPG